MTVRKVITRSKKTFRVKFPSRKNKCTIHCESILEADTARLFEISPFVRSYTAQPSVEIYYDEIGESHKYVPDFRVVLHNDTEVDIEVKPEAKLSDLRIKAKIEAIFARYCELGRHFRIITERQVQVEPLRCNLQLLLCRSRAHVSSAALRALKQKLKRKTFETIGDVTAILDGETHVLRLIADGYLASDLSRTLTSASPVWIREPMEGDDNDPFRI